MSIDEAEQRSLISGLVRVPPEVLFALASEWESQTSMVARAFLHRPQIT